LDTVLEGWGEFYKKPREKKGIPLGKKQLKPVKTLVATGAKL